MFLTPETMEEELRANELWKDGNKFFAAHIFLDGTANTMINVVVNKTDTELYIVPCDYATNELIKEQGVFIKNENITLIEISKGNFGFNKISLYKDEQLLTSFQISVATKGEALENIKSILNSYPNQGMEILDKKSPLKNDFVVSLMWIFFTIAFLVVGVLMLLDGEFSGILVLAVGVFFMYMFSIYLKRILEERAKEKEEENNSPIK